MEQLLILAKQVSKYCVGMEGNISMKTEDGLIIKASGSKLANLSLNDLVHYNLNGVQISNLRKKGSMELNFHKYLLSFNDINFVSHTHPTNTVKILSTEVCNLFSSNRLFPDQVIFNGAKSCLVPYANPGKNLTNLIMKEVDLYINTENCFPKLILLKNHGIITCGKTIDECVMSTDICDKAAEIFIGAKTLGEVNYLSSDAIKELLEDNNEKYRQDLLK